MPELPQVNPVIHGKLRLALLALLAGVEKAEFTWLRAKTGSTDGNLGAQLLKLEEAGYVQVEKKFVRRKPQTLYRMTKSGRRALSEYVQALQQLLGPATQTKNPNPPIEAQRQLPSPPFSQRFAELCLIRRPLYAPGPPRPVIA